MRCQEFREMMDSYISDELLVETNHEVLRHLENCVACRNEFAAHRQLRVRVRLAVKNSPESQINSVFASRLQTGLRETALQPTLWRQIRYSGLFNFKILAFAAAGLLIVSMFGAVWLNNSPSNETFTAENNQSNQEGETPQPVESPIAQAVQAAWREIAHTAIGDHENCALHHRLKENPITLTEAARQFGRFNQDLDKAVIAAVKQSPASKSADKITFLGAHSCVFEGRRFAHVALKYRNRVVSILVTDTDLPGGNGEVIAEQFDDRMQAASFSADHHAVFVVSDLTEAENSTIARIISPFVRRHIEKAEA